MVTSPVCLHDSEVPDGFKEDGSVVTWGGVLKSLMDLLGEGSTAAIPKSLMDSLDDGFVVTWRRMRVEFPPCDREMCQWSSVFVAIFRARSFPQR